MSESTNLDLSVPFSKRGVNIMTKKLYEKKSKDGKRTFTISKTTGKEKVQFIVGALAIGLIIWWLVK